MGGSFEADFSISICIYSHCWKNAGIKEVERQGAQATLVSLPHATEQLQQTEQLMNL